LHISLKLSPDVSLKLFPDESWQKSHTMANPRMEKSEAKVVWMMAIDVFSRGNTFYYVEVSCCAKR
jgi:hypothetical protein